MSGDDRGRLLVMDAWTALVGRGVYPSVALIRRATGMGPNRVVRLRDELLRRGVLVLPDAIRDGTRGRLATFLERRG